MTFKWRASPAQRRCNKERPADELAGGFSPDPADVRPSAEEPPVSDNGARRSPSMDDWKRSFLNKLNQAQSHWTRRFDETLALEVVPVFDELAEFLRKNGFRVSAPLVEEGRRSFKFELNENTYCLLIFRAGGVGEFELRCECFAPGREPLANRTTTALNHLTRNWVEQQFRDGLDRLVELLAGSDGSTAELRPELLGV